MHRRNRYLPVCWALAALVSLGAAPPSVPGPKLADPDRPPPPLAPADAAKRFKVADGLAIGLAASEPEVTQPLSISFDDRGRMWVLQYRQYPLPEGLKAVQMDQYLRTKYDRVPEPPPKGPKGRDRISIYEDVNGDGHFKLVKHFVSDLNLASGMALGYDGVFVVQPPYLLFYPDRNHDDVPDSGPEVLLRGFGMEDAHAFANSLTWGPDGWLYGCQGSTVTANIRGIEFQQGAWRYHPRTRQFELFAEGEETPGASSSTASGTSSPSATRWSGWYTTSRGRTTSRGSASTAPCTTPMPTATSSPRAIPAPSATASRAGP